MKYTDMTIHANEEQAKRLEEMFRSQSTAIKKQKSKADRMVRKGLKEFCINGVFIWAINEKNAKRKYVNVFSR